MAENWGVRDNVNDSGEPLLSHPYSVLFANSRKKAFRFESFNLEVGCFPAARQCRGEPANATTRDCESNLAEAARLGRMRGNSPNLDEKAVAMSTRRGSSLDRN
ncbi:hypothetical protein ACJJTC_018603 [Scirpophaga incertulas]